jgi:hypothetical protein
MARQWITKGKLVPQTWVEISGEVQDYDGYRPQIRAGWYVGVEEFDGQPWHFLRDGHENGRRVEGVFGFPAEQLEE